MTQGWGCWVLQGPTFSLGKETTFPGFLAVRCGHVTKHVRDVVLSTLSFLAEMWMRVLAAILDSVCVVGERNQVSKVAE
jgi:hypothetical protein